MDEYGTLTDTELPLLNNCPIKFKAKQINIPEQTK